MKEQLKDAMHIDVKNLTFGYAGRKPVLKNLNMQLTDGDRCLLIGANGVESIDSNGTVTMRTQS